MNEFEWLRQMRDLRREQRPSHDLWPGIAKRLPARTRHHPASRWLPLAASAAVLVLGLLTGVAALRAPHGVGQAAAQASAHWKPGDPRLDGAAIEFAAADSEIRLALQQAPDAAFLRRIRARTQAQQWRLQRYARRAP